MKWKCRAMYGLLNRNNSTVLSFVCYVVWPTGVCQCQMCMVDSVNHTCVHTNEYICSVLFVQAKDESNTDLHSFYAVHNNQINV